MTRIIAAVVLTIALAGPAIVAVSAAQDRDRVADCGHNLAQLWKLQFCYQIQFGGAARQMPVETGRDFWLALTRTTPPMLDKTSASLFQCPVEDLEGVWGTCDYRGPIGNVNKAEKDDPVGADIDGNHGKGKGGNVLKKDGSVQRVAADDNLWTTTAVKTTVGPPLPPRRMTRSGSPSWKRRWPRSRSTSRNLKRSSSS